MPVVQVYLYKGKSKEVKKELVKRITKDFEEVAKVPPEALHILFHDVKRRIGEREGPSPRTFRRNSPYSI